MLRYDFSIIESGAPCVSIIVTTFNRQKLLRETVNSILSQTFENFELIIVDNMSEDGTKEYIGGISDNRVKYFRNPNGGVIAVNRNFGIKNSRGVYIAFCDDDDLWYPTKLDQQVTLLNKNADVTLCYTQAESFLDDKIVAPRMNRRYVYRNHFSALLRGNYFPNSSVIVRSYVFEKLGLLTENPSLREDYEMWLRIAKHYKLKGFEASLIRYRMHSSNVAGNRALETLRAIRTVRSVCNLLDIPFYLVWPNVVFQYLKYIFYKFLRFK